MKAFIAIAIATIIMLLFLTWHVTNEAYGEEHEANISWKQQQLQEKFNNVNASDYTSFEKQMAKVQQTRDYLKYWGWRQ